MLRRRLREYEPDAPRTITSPARLQRAQDMLAEIWVRSGPVGEKHPSWRLVEGLLRMALDRVAPLQAAPASDHIEPVHAERAT
jgi:hypothetical protein